MAKKVISIVLCLALVVALAVPAFAATVFFTSTVDGYDCVGSGYVTKTYAKATFEGTPYNGGMIPPAETCNCSSTMNVFSSNGQLITSVSRTGNIYCTSSYSSSSGAIARTVSMFSFQSRSWGGYTLYA